jgi:hypothetical protein
MFGLMAAISIVASSEALCDTATVVAISGGQSNAADGTVSVAVDQKPEGGKYLCLLLYKEKNAKLDSFQNAVEGFLTKQAGKAEFITVDALAATSKDILQKYKIDAARMPMPLLMIIAPNGAVTAAFAAAPDEQKLAGAIVSERGAQCLKFLQDGKVVLLCVQGAAAKNKEKAMAGVDAYLVDKTYTNTAGKVVLNPDDPGDKAFLQKFNTTMATNEAVTIVVAPPGKIAATFKGATTKVALAKAVQDCGCAGGA